MNLRLPITNNEISAQVYYVKPKETILSVWTRKIWKNNRKFWKTVNPLFSEKSCSKELISLIHEDV